LSGHQGVGAGVAELLYLSLLDYVQHKYVSGEADGDVFHPVIGRRVRRLLELARSSG
jgi:hypothetical protein